MNGGRPEAWKLNVDHQELRRAFEHFLAAKRALDDAYKKSGATHGLVESLSELEGAELSRIGGPINGKL